MMKTNIETRNVKKCLVSIIFGLILFAVPVIFKVNMIQWGYAACVFGVLFTIIGFILFFMFRKRALVLEEMIRDENNLACWKYDSNQWNNEIKDELNGLSMIRYFASFIGGLLALIGFIMFLTNTDDLGGFFVIMLGIGLFIFLIALWSVSVRKKRLLGDCGEAFIAAKGLYYKSILYTWGGLTSELAGVGLDKEVSTRLHFVIKTLGMSRLTRIPKIQTHNIKVLIPTGQEETALKVVNYFNKPIEENVN